MGKGQIERFWKRLNIPLFNPRYTIEPIEISLSEANKAEIRQIVHEEIAKLFEEARE